MVSNQVFIVDHLVRKGYFVRNRKHKWTTKEGGYFGGKTIPAGSYCEFFETQNFGFVKFTTPEGQFGLARE